MSVFHIREAREEDVFGMAKVRVDTWRVAYKEIMPDDLLENLSYQATAERWRKAFWEDKDPNVAVFVAENEQSEIIGIAICGLESNQDPIYQGEIYVLYVLPEYQRQGIGRRLVASCAEYLIQQLRVKTMLIWVLADNPYRRFYESLGGKVIQEKTKEFGGKMLSEVGYGWEEISELS